jgi:ubiquinone/menaquinone biosynthesis C-methylase UbiE
MIFGRLFAAVYDRGLAATEEAGLRDARRDLLAGASGDVLELGAGTGLNREHVPPGVGRLVLTEPDEHMARRLAGRIRPGDELVQAGAEALPLEDASIDTVVATLVLCTVRDPDRALAEVARVLRPGGRLLFLEHVRAEDPGLARWQDRLERPWGLFAGGCRPNRDTQAAIERSPLELVEVRATELPKAPGIIRPAIVGTAARPAAKRP